MASALGETIGNAVVTREHFDLRFGEMREYIDLRLGEMNARADQRFNHLDMTMATKVEVADAKSDVLKWMFGAVGLQIIAILGGVAALLRLIH